MILKPVAEGGDLGEYLHDYREFINSGRPEDIKHAQEGKLILVRAFGCLANELSFMHQKRIRHKDVKSSYIILQHGHVIYTDFDFQPDSAKLVAALPMTHHKASPGGTHPGSYHPERAKFEV